MHSDKQTTELIPNQKLPRLPKRSWEEGDAPEYVIGRAACEFNSPAAARVSRYLTNVVAVLGG